MKIAISIGDLNGVGLEIALRAHDEVKALCQPIYCINENMLAWGAALLGLEVPSDFETRDCGKIFEIKPGLCSAEAGESSYDWLKFWRRLIKVLLSFRIIKNLLNLSWIKSIP